jgi:hypothetical protein
MNKIDILRYVALTLVFITLLLPQDGTGWIWTLSIAGLIILGTIISKVGIKNSWQFLAVSSLILILFSEIGSTFQKWMIVVFVITAGIWVLKKWVFKS